MQTERPGERFSSEYFESNTNKILDWKAEINLFNYIDNFKISNAKNH